MEGFMASAQRGINAGQSLKDNKRKNEQYEIVKDNQAKIKSMREAKQIQDNSEGGELQQVKQQLTDLQEQTRKTDLKATGDSVKKDFATSATSVGSPNAGANMIKSIESDEKKLKALNLTKGQYKAFDSKGSEHGEAFDKYLNESGTDYSKWPPEYKQLVKDMHQDSGLSFVDNVSGKYVSSTDMIPKMGALGSVGKDEINIYEGKQANLQAMLEGPDAYKKALEEAKSNPETRSFFKDYLDKLPPSQREKLEQRKEVISGQSDKENLNNMEKLQAELDAEGFGQDTDPTKGQTIPEEQVMDTEPKKNTMSEPVTMEPNEDGTKSGKGVMTQPDGNKVTVTANTDINGNGKVKGSDGSSATIQKDGAGIFKQANGDITTVGSNGQSVTVKADGKVVPSTEDYVLPDDVQMAYDILGIKSEFSKTNVLARKAKETQIAKYEDDMAKADSTMGKYVSDFVEMGLGTEAEGLDAYNTSKAANKSNRAPTYVEEYRKSSAWMANNQDKKGTPEYKQHATVANRFSNELRTATQKDNDATSSTIMDKYGLDMKDMYEPGGKVSGNGLAIDAKIRGNDKIYTKEVKKRETEAYDTAQSVANLGDLGIKINKGVASGEYKSGYLDSAANWMQSKAGSDFIYDATSGEIGAKLESQLGIEGELAIELGRVVKAAYGGNASNTDRETIAGAMAGLSSDDEAVRKQSFDNFQRTMKKLNAQNMQFFSQEGLHKTTERLSDTANTQFDSQGNINEGKPSDKRSEVKKGGKGTRQQFQDKAKGVTFFKGGKPYHFKKNGQLAKGEA